MKQTFNKARIKKFLSYYRPYRGIFILDLFFASAASVALLAFPLVSGYITKTVLGGWNSQTQRLLTEAGLLLLLLVVVRILCSLLYGYLGHAMGARMEGDMRKELFAHYQRQHFAFFDRQGVGGLMTILSNDLTSMTEVFHHGPENILIMLIQLVGAFVVLLNINLPLTLIVFSVFPLLGLVAVVADRKMGRGLAQAKADLTQMNNRTEDALSGIRTVKAFGNEAHEHHRYAECNQAYVKSFCYFYKVEAVFYEVVGGYPQLVTMLVIFFGAVLLGKGSLDLPVLVTFLLYVSCLCEPVHIATVFLKLYEEGKVGFGRFMDMLDREPQVQEAAQPLEREEIRGEVAFAGVTFAYDAHHEPVLEALSFDLRAGESVALVGESGIGKTTVSNLLARFYDVTDGSITIDGIDLRQLSFATLRRSIGIVQQEAFIFNGTIRDNILYGRQDATPQEVEEAARLANAHQFIQKLEQGYDTPVGARGMTLSGGQRQRISLARVFLKNPPILILDEATSALDYESEALVQQSIQQLMQNRTTLVIAHRLSTIRQVDRILLLGGGGIVEEGTHHQLLEQDGAYARLYRMNGV